MSKRTTSLRFQPSGGIRAQQLPVGKKQQLSIARLAHDGRGVAFLQGRTWFVSGALAHEQVEARILNSRGKVVEARCERVLLASPLRQTPRCQHAGECGGCSLQHLPWAEQLALKQQALAEQLSQIAKITPQIWATPLSGPPYAYRRRARLAVRWNPATQQLDVGFRAAASQQIVTLRECPVLVQPLQTLLPGLLAVLQDLRDPHALGHVELFSDSAVAILVRLLKPLHEADRQRLTTFCHGQQVQLWLQQGARPQPQEAGQTLTYHLAPWALELNYQPGDFVQVNAQVNQAMLSQALDWLALSPDERVLDLFCGLGNFALPMAHQAREVVGVEGVAEMVERAQANATHNGLDNAHFYQADLSNPRFIASTWGREFAAILLDPPRDGALSIVQGISRLAARRVLYVSCNPATLARDAAELSRQGFQLARAGILDMFAQTAHVEAMALFLKS